MCAGSMYVAQADFKAEIPLPQPFQSAAILLFICSCDIQQLAYYCMSPVLLSLLSDLPLSLSSARQHTGGPVFLPGPQAAIGFVSQPSLCHLADLQAQSEVLLLKVVLGLTT